MSVLSRFFYGLKVWAYCLMPNHVHVVAVPEHAFSMARALGRAHSDYARHFNIQRQSCGHVWQARFFSCPLDGAHLWRAMAYVERNPVRVGLVGEASAYRWSSASAHLRGYDGEEFLDLSAWSECYTPNRWREVLETSVSDEALAERLREATIRGRPLGSAEFVDDLERRILRHLRPQRAGRPKKRVADGEQLALKIGDSSM